MSNNKQSSVEWYIIERHTIEIQSRLGLISPIEYDAKLIKIEEQAKAMHKEEISEAFDDGEYNYFYSRKTGNDFENGIEYYEEKFGGNND